MTNKPNVLADVIRTRAVEDPDRVAITDGSRSVSYLQLDELSNRAANALREMGVVRGDRLAFLARNRIEYFELMFAAAKLGAAVVPVNWRLAPNEVDAVLDDAQPHLLVIEHDLLHLVDTHIASLNDRLLLLGAPAETRDWARCIGGASAVDPCVDVEPDEVMWQLYTSGTTGAPKGVMLMHRNLFSMVEQLADAWHFDPRCVVYMPYPSFHAVGNFWPVIAMCRGGLTLLRRSFDPADFVRTVEENQVTLAMMVPAVLNMVLAEPEARRRDLSSLRHVVYGASPISQSVLNLAIDLLPGCSFHHAYGLTESTGTVTTMQWEDHRVGTDRMKSCGPALPWVEMRIVDPDTGDEASTGDVGEVLMRGPTVMKGYYNAPAATAEALDGGWLHTGDAGFLDADGYLFLTDRVKDMIISGGENIYPAEIENVLFAHPDIREAAVVGIPDDRWGEVVLAIVVPEDGCDVEPDEVIQYCRSYLARYKCPARVEVRWDSLPLNPTGKVLRRELRTIYCESPRAAAPDDIR